MRYHNLYIAGVGSWYPAPVSVEHAVATGLAEPGWMRATGQISVTVAADTDSPPEMAVRAGRAALSSCGLPEHDFGLLLHAVAGYNGLEGWDSATYLQQRILGGDTGTAFEVRQLSNGAVAAVELAAAYLFAGTKHPAALITAADCFGAPAWDRWRAHPGLAFSDGASAIALSVNGGFARICSLVSVADPQLEGMQRGNAAFRSCPDPATYPIDLLERSEQFLESIDPAEVTARMHGGLHRAVTTAAAEAGTSIGDIEHVVLPNFGLEMLRHDCLRPLGIGIEHTTWAWGTRIGHTGAADQFGGLDHLARTGTLRPGQMLALVGIGGTTNWTCIICQITTTSANTP